MKREVIIEKTVSFINNKLAELSSKNPIILMGRPIINRIVNNNIEKVDSFLKLIEDKNGDIDVEGILSETIDNLIVAQLKSYPEIFNGLEIGNGSIKVNIPLINKAIVFDSKDIDSFKQVLTKK